MITLLAKLLNALNSENSTRQIALGIALALVYGLSPVISLQAFVLLFVVLLIKVHLASFILAVGIFKGLSYGLSGMAITVGEYLLTSDVLSGVFNTLYQFDIFKLAHLHHTYNLGSFVLGTAIAVPLYFAAKLFIEKYRQHIKAYFEQLSIVKALKATKLYTLYLSLSSQGQS